MDGNQHLLLTPFKVVIILTPSLRSNQSAENNACLYICFNLKETELSQWNKCLFWYRFISLFFVLFVFFILVCNW